MRRLLLLIIVLGVVALCIQVIESLQAPESGPRSNVANDVLHLRLGAPPVEDPAVEDVDYHIVQPGETLSDIAQRLLGDARRAGELAALNGLSNPDALRSGQRILLR